jgi:hypothetical protein
MAELAHAQMAAEPLNAVDDVWPILGWKIPDETIELDIELLQAPLGQIRPVAAIVLE